jgi:MFS transporter, UMF1 family
MTKKEFAWAMYDWANSVFFTTVVAGFFPIFFKEYWSAGASSLESTARLGLVLGVSGFLIAISSPLLGVLSDYRRFKKTFLFLYTLLGSLATAGLFFVEAGQWSLAAFLYGVGWFFSSAGSVYYDALLVNVTSPDRYDRISSYGFAFGYLGGGLLFIFNLLMYQNPEWFGLATGADGVRWSFVSVAIWWIVFALPLMIYVPEPDIHRGADRLHLWPLVKKAVRELSGTFKKIFVQKNLFYFVVAYWFYIDGVGTVISMAVDFGMSLGFAAGDLIKALLLTQFVGFPAALGAGRLAERYGSKALIMLSLFVYMAVVVGASQMSEASHFFWLASFIGLAQGAVQALSRSLFAQLIPGEMAGEYFGFYNLLGKFAAIFGPFLMSLTARVVDRPQYTILSLLILFTLGVFFLRRVRLPRA